MKIGIGHAHGKIILIGEHSVVYSQPAIALPFKGVQVSVKVTPSEDMTIDCIYHQGLLEEAPGQLDNIKAVTLEVFKRLNKQQNFNIHIESTIPQERGMGSSAAVANATIAAIYDYYDEVLDKQTQFELAQVAEAISHGDPSGLDALITVSDKPLYFVKGQEIAELDIETKGYLIIGDTGEKGQTKLAVQALGQRKLENPQLVDELIYGLGRLAHSVKELLKGNDLYTIGSIMNKSQQYLSQMGISNSSLNNLITISNQSGSLGSKLTGGGWGGCMLALSDDLILAQQIEEALLKNNARQTWVLAF
ncbi:MAG: mevalonate kinase [Erysipelothrix sp.]|nr:mevalonate kinase [Erysipelothrix sp.]